MALNYSHRPIFPAHISEDNLAAPMRIVNGYLVQGVPENGEGFTRSRIVNREVDDCFEYGGGRVDMCGSPESASKDIIDLLPSDPFGMDISTTFTALTGWFEDFEVDNAGYGRSSPGVSKEDYGLFAGLNLIWNNAMMFQSFSGNMLFESKPQTVSQMYEFIDAKKVGASLNKDDFMPVQISEDLVESDSGSAAVISQKTEERPEDAESCSAEGGGTSHEAFSYVLYYLGLGDLLSVEGVCRSFRSLVQNEPLLWTNIHIKQPLSERITDDVLLQLTSRAQGDLQCLSLVECPRVTIDCLRCILEANPRLTKLCVPGCTRLSIEGIVNILKAFNCKQGTPGIKHLRIGGLYGMTNQHFEELNSLLGIDMHHRQIEHKPHFYSRGSFYILCDDNRVIDIEKCPKCQNLRLIYDCPAEACQQQGHSPAQVCRGCILCIARCVQCGRCVNDSEYEETFCLELLCSDCFKQHIHSQERSDDEVWLANNSVLLQPDSNM